MPVSGMTREVPRTRFHSSKLIRILEDLAMADIPDSRQSFGERLGQWLDFKDAISLYSVLHGDFSEITGRSNAKAEVCSLHDELARVRSSIVEAIRVDNQLDANKVAITASSSDLEVDFVPYHRSYLAHQRSMQSAVSTLRARMRAVLANKSPSGRRLAALDGALEQALAARERGLLAIVPLLLERRFNDLLRARRKLGGNDHAPYQPSNEWLAGFCRDVQAVLLAELDLRLQPVFGLMDTLGKEVTQQQ